MNNDSSPDFDATVLDRLYATIVARRNSGAKDSYTVALISAGTPHIARKVGEETVETIIEALAGDNERLTAESADLLYHLLVLWAVRGVHPHQVWASLRERERRATGQ
jgi:phosphoribosyl-ATP pyrophosphohydrolase